MAQVFQIQFHGPIDRTKRLVRWLGHDRNYFVICYDRAKVAPEQIAILVRELGDERVAYIPRDLMWAGWSQVDSTLHAMSVAVARDWRWDYFINLSDTDIPIKSPAALANFLGAAAVRKQSFIFCFPHWAPPGYVRIPGEPEGEYRVLDPWAQPDRPRFLVQDTAVAIFEKLLAGHFGHNEIRINLWVEEDFAAKALRIRKPSTEESDARLAFFNGHTHRFGRQWICLRRPVCEAVVRDGLGEARAILSTVLVPDECFFQTVLLGRTVAPDEDFVLQNLHFRDGAPTWLVDESQETLESCDKFFGRKLILNSSSDRLVDWVERICDHRSTAQAVR